MLTFDKLDRSPKMAELKVTYRRRGTKPPETPLDWPVSVALYLRLICDEGTIELREAFIVLYLNAGLLPIGWVRHSVGTVRATVLDARLVFGVALRVNAVSVVLAHNHPGGSNAPSHEDSEMTRRLAKAGDILGVELVDHVILIRSTHFSFCDAGLL
jgi:DNA repair protein RadC